MSGWVYLINHHAACRVRLAGITCEQTVTSTLEGAASSILNCLCTSLCKTSWHWFGTYLLFITWKSLLLQQTKLKNWIIAWCCPLFHRGGSPTGVILPFQSVYVTRALLLAACIWLLGCWRSGAPAAVGVQQIWICHGRIVQAVFRRLCSDCCHAGCTIPAG